MTFQYLSKADIIHFNRQLLKKENQPFIEPHNLKNESTLDYIVGMANHEFYYPDFYSKASLYIYNINTGHAFWEGNKRTSLMSLHAFIKMNNRSFKTKFSIICLPINGTTEQKLVPNISTTNREIILQSFVEEIASSQLDREEVIKFLKENIT